MLNRIKNIFNKTDSFLFKKFGTDKSVKVLENIREARKIFSSLKQKLNIGTLNCRGLIELTKREEIVKLMESEFALCGVDKSSKIFNSHKCDSSSSPSTNTISNYINNS